MHEETAYARLAGFIDGEGYIGQKCASQPYPVIEISMTHEATVTWLHKTFEGGCIYTPKTLKPNRRQFWKWTLSGKGIRRHLPSAYPFLLTKKPQAVLMLEWLDLLAQSSSQGAFQPIRQEEIRLGLQKLNQRGRSK